MGRDKDTIICISRYTSHYSAQNGRHVPGCIPEDTDVYSELTKFKNGFYSRQINTMLALNEEQQKEYKQQNLTSITFSCKTKEWRKERNICSRSGCIVIDVDGQDNEDIEDWPGLRDHLVKEMGARVIAAFLSARQRGIFIILKIDPTLHKETFNFISYEFKKTYNLNIDTCCKDETRLRFVTCDKGGYINYDWESIPIILPTDDYKKKINVIKRSTTFKTIKVKKADTPELFKNAVAKAEYDYKIETGGDFEFAPGNRHRILVAIAGYCNVRGMNREFCIEEAEKKYYADGYDIARAVKNVYTTYPDQHASLDINEYGNEELQTWLKTYNLRRNEITRIIEWDGQGMEQKDFNTIFLEAKKVFPKISYDLVERTIISNFTESYNPLKDFIEKNKHRKPEGLIRILTDTINSNTGFGEEYFFPDYKHYFFKKWLVSIIASIYGDHSYLMLVLCGNIQGTGKTEFLRRLLPEELGMFYAESKLDAGKDDEILMCKKLLISDDEYGGKSKADERKIKELLSKHYFTLREPYGRHHVDLKRIAVLCATTNFHEILSDPTGNRRIIPLDVQSIDHEAYNAINKTDLFMEAYHLYEVGFNWKLTHDDVKNLNRNTGDFEQTSIEADLLQKFFLPGVGDNAAIFLTATEIKSRLETTMQKVSITRLGMELKKLDYVRYAKKQNGRTIRGYDVIELAVIGVNV